MKLLYGTGNSAKLDAMRSRLAPLHIQLIGLADLEAAGYTIPKVPETGTTPLENARQKALAYYEAFGVPVFSCDSGLYFDGLPDALQPGVHVRTVNGKALSDEEMMARYGSLARQYGGLTAHYKNAICLVLGPGQVHAAMEPTMESERFRLIDKPHSAIRRKGFPLDSMSIHIPSGRYFYDLPPEMVDQVAVEDGFLQFFRTVLGQG